MESFYIHGTTPEEQERLSALNVLLNEEALKTLSIQVGDRVLDVGSGLGQFSRAIARQVGSDGYVLGIERDQKQLNSAILLAEAAEEQHLVDFRLGDAQDLQLEKEEWESFDLVHCRFVLEHLLNPVKAVEKMIAAVKPGGRVFLADDDHAVFRVTPEPVGFQALWKAYLRSYDRIGNDPIIGRHLVGLLKQQGLSNIRNGLLFFGGCADHPHWHIASNNLITILVQVRDLLIERRLISKGTFDQGIEALDRWKDLPDAAIWYEVCWAQGIR